LLEQGLWINYERICTMSINAVNLGQFRRGFLSMLSLSMVVLFGAMALTGCGQKTTPSDEAVSKAPPPDESGGSPESSVAPPSPDEIAELRAQDARGHAAYDAGDMPGAIQAWTSALNRYS
jgi:hypothetical protein